ncbi:MAG TPA: hypothetical protein VMQ61_06745 [Thermoanaerobaculia bacterium]|nr:hypothetical protein [Thermoanaerobaculia bacterium]
MASNVRTPPRTSRRRGKRALLAAILVALPAAFLLHAAAARRLLAAGTLKRLLNTQPEMSAMDWDEATSLIPGRVRVRGFRLYGNDGSVAWSLRLEEARLTYSVLELAARRFHVTALSGSGLSFRAEPTTIIPRPEQRGASGSPWTVRVDAISVGRVFEIRIGSYRFEGTARLAGRFRLTPHRAAEVGPAEITIASGTLRLGPDPMLELEPGGRIAARIAAWDPRELPGSAVWRRVSGRVRLRGTVAGLDFLDHYLGNSPSVRFAGGKGRARVDAEMGNGVAKGGARLSAANVRAMGAGFRLAGDVRAGIRLVHGPLEGGAVDLSGSEVDLTEVSQGEGTAPEWWGRFVFPRAAWGRAFEAQVQARCRDARPLLAVARVAPPKLARRAFSLDDLSLTADLGIGPNGLDVRNLDAKSEALQVEGAYRKNRARADGVFWIDAGKINVGLSVEDGRARWRPIPTRSWFDRRRGEIGREGSGAAARDYAARSTTTAVP